MLSIFAKKDTFHTIEQFIQSENRLEELIQLLDIEQHKPTESGLSLSIENNTIESLLDWENRLPPYILPKSIPLDKNNFLGIIFGKLYNLEKVAEYLSSENPLYQEFFITLALQQGTMIPQNTFDAISQSIQDEAFDTYRNIHNQAICTHYGMVEKITDFDTLCQLYEEAIKLAPDAEYLAFTSRHYVMLLLDAQSLERAEQVIGQALKAKPCEEAEFALKSLLVQLLMSRVYVPYDWKLIEQIKGLVWETLQYFEAQNNKTEMAMLLIDASEIANIKEHYTESLGYINKAIANLEEENLTEFIGSAQIRKATLLYTWAQNGNPQFYRGALSAYQEALKIYKKEENPEMFAEIQQQLGIIYSEMPDEPQKQQMWAAMSAKAFNEALDFFIKATHPYEYAMVCNNYANALTKFPVGLRVDNYPKAIELYEEALQIRNEGLPYERAITLLNYLEAQWFMTQDDEKTMLEQKLKTWEDMHQKAKEVLNLVDDPVMLKEANIHLEKLENLKSVLLEE